MGSVTKKESPASTIGVVGAGVMGRGIAQVAMMAGFKVVLYDLRLTALDDAVKFIHKMLDRAVEKERMTAKSVIEAKRNLHLATTLNEGFDRCDVVIEAASEDLEVKREIFRTLESEVSSGCVLATNTSSLSVAAIAKESRYPGRIAGMHFFNPVPLIKLIELVASPVTAPQTIDYLESLAGQLGHRSIRVSDSPGFVVNHAGRGLITEGLQIVSEGVASFADVDLVMREAAGFKLGPFELMDLTGLDVSLTVMESIYNQYYQEPRYRPSHIARARAEAGLIGRKAGRGFYAYDRSDAEASAPALPSDYSHCRVWVEGERKEEAESFRGLLERAGVDLDTGDRADSGSICIVMPYGRDATMSALARGLNPSRTVAVDPLFNTKNHRSLMTTPATDRQVRDQVTAILSADGAQVTVMRDSAGFIAQRVIAMIVNIASDMAQQRIAAPADIDKAVKSALGYPWGPLEWGDKIGARVILGILNAMMRFYRDPRYRASPWLVRRAKLDISLLEVGT